MHSLLVTLGWTTLLGLVVCTAAFGYATIMGYVDSRLGTVGPPH